MKGTKFLLSFWLSTATFCLLQVLLGPGGLTQTAELEAQNRLLDNRLTQLQADNARLTARYEALRTSRDAIRLEARQLGWFRPGETPVRTPGGSTFALPSESPDLSTVPELKPRDAEVSLFFRLAWPLLFLLCWGSLSLAERLRPDTERLPAVFEPPRLTLPPVLQSGLDFFRK